MAGLPKDDEYRRRHSGKPGTCGLPACLTPRPATSEQDGRHRLWTNVEEPTFPTARQMPKLRSSGHRPVPGLGSASRAHLLAGLAAPAATDAGFADLVTCGARAAFAGFATAAAGADDVVPTTVNPGTRDAGFATPMTFPSESRRKAADSAGTIPIRVALIARSAGDFDASNDWLRAPWVSVS